MLSFKGLWAAFAEIATGLEEIRHTVAAAVAGKQPPMDREGVAEALRDSATRIASSREYGIQWLIDVKDKGLWPMAALSDEPFMARFLQQKSGIFEPPVAPLPTATANEVLASAQPPASVGKASSDSFRLLGNASTPLTGSGSLFPFSAAIAGKHVKIDLPRPSKFSRPGGGTCHSSVT